MNQHYVPRVYLKNFSLARNNEYFVNAYDKTTKNNFLVNIKKICGEKDLYTLDINDKDYGDPLIIESGYANYFEPLYDKIYKLLVDDNVVAISLEQRNEILVGIFQLFFRNTKMLNDMIDYHCQNLEWLYHKAKFESNDKFHYIDREYEVNRNLHEIKEGFKIDTRYYFKKQHFQAFAQLVLSNSYQSINIYKLVDDSKFITCDNPLSNVNLKQDSKNPFQRISQFFLPLNEKYCLFLFNDKTKALDKIYRENVYSGRSFLVNDHMLNNAQRFLIGSQNEIVKLIQTRDILETEYETNIDKLIVLVKGIHTIMKEQKMPSEHLEVIEKFIKKYEDSGTISEIEKREFFKESLVHYKQYFLNRL